MTKHGPWPGNTSIVKIQDTLIPGSLATWGAGEAVEAILAGRPWGKAADIEIRQAAMNRVQRAQRIGTEVHSQVASLLTEREQTWTPELLPYLQSYSAFLIDERPEYLAVEQRVIHSRAKYGGTLDFIARFPRFGSAVVLGDIKTGKGGPDGGAKDGHRLQLAGYMAAEGFGGEIDQWHRYWWDGSPLAPIPRITRCVLLYLRVDGYELVPVDVTAADRRHFLYLAGAYHRLRAWQSSLNGKEHA